MSKIGLQLTRPCDTVLAMVPFSRGSLFLAPMVGITNRAFRTLVCELGAPDWFVTEMASAEAFLSGGRNESIYLDPSPRPLRTSVQFAARSPETLAKACTAVSRLPAEYRPAGIDINMGCSAPHIKGYGRGAALLDNPSLAREMVAAAREQWGGMLSAKIRISTSLGEDGTVALAQSLASAGLDCITVHARFDTQKFRRKADHRFAALLAEALPIPVIANGDITSRDECDALLDSTHIHSLMIGRAAAQKPWLFASLKSGAGSGGGGRVTPQSSELESKPQPGTRHMPEIDLLAIALRFIELVETLLPSEWQKETCRRVFSYYAENVSFAHHLRFSLINAPSLDAMRQILRDYFDQVPQDRIFVQDKILA